MVTSFDGEVRVNVVKASGIFSIAVAAFIACSEGLDESEIDLRIESAVSTAIADLPPVEDIVEPTLQPTIFNQPLSIVRAQSFDAIDADGNLRAQLSITEEGNGRMVLFDAAGVIRAALGPTSDGSSFVDLTDSAGVTRGRLVVNADGQPEIRLFDDQGGTRLGLSLRGGPGKLDSWISGIAALRWHYDAI